MTDGPRPIPAERACESCGTVFTPNKDGTRVCFSCFYSGAVAAATERFRPYGEAIEARTGMTWDVWQTGGMVMCMAVKVRDGVHLLAGEPGDYDKWSFGFDVADDEAASEVGFESYLPTSTTTPEQVADWLGRIVELLQRPTRSWPYGLDDDEVTLARLSADLPRGFEPGDYDTAANLRHLAEHSIDGSQERVLRCVAQLCAKFPTLAPAVALDVATTWEFG